MTDWIRVSDKRTGHQYTIAEHAFEPGVHVKIDHAEAVDQNGNPRPAKHNMPLGKASDKKTEPQGSEGVK